MLPPLFGKPALGEPDPLLGVAGFKISEDEAMEQLTLLRREASLSQRERELLEHLAQDRADMIRDLDTLQSNFASFGSLIFADEERYSPLWVSKYPTLPRNVLAWDHNTIVRELKRVEMWKGVKAAVAKINSLTEGVYESLLIPEDAFDSEI